jgi:hypothetical protein
MEESNGLIKLLLSYMIEWKAIMQKLLHIAVRRFSQLPDLFLGLRKVKR